MAPNQTTIVSDPDAFQVSFSDNGSMFAVVSQAVDLHRLMVWESGTNKLHAKFSDSAVSKFSCIAWGQDSVSVYSAPVEGSSKKRKKTLAQQPAAAKKLDVMAIGSAVGSIHLFSPAHSSIVKELKGAHSKSVHDIVFSALNDRLYSCSSDGMVVEWDLTSKSALSNWHAETGSIDKMCLSSDGNFLATASSESIKVWKLEDKTLVQQFSGFSSAVDQLISIGDYFLSSCKNDRYINVWAKEKNANIVLTAPCTLTGFSVTAGGSLVAAVTEDGQVCVWSNKPLQRVEGGNKRASKTKSPTGFIKFMTPQDVLIPVISVCYRDDNALLVARGSTLKPVFEIVEIDTAIFLESQEVLELVRSSADTGDEQLMNGKSFENPQQQRKKDRNARMVGTFDAPIAKSVASQDKGSEVTMGEKLEALKILEAEAMQGESQDGPSSSDQTNIPKPDSLLQMLTQALHSSDKELMEECLKVHQVPIIQKTVSQLPTQHVVPFLTQIVERFQNNPNRAQHLAKWLQILLASNLSYLVAHPGLVSCLTPLYQTIDARLANFQDLLKLNGRLELLNQQIKIRGQLVSAKRETMLEDVALLERPMMIYDEYPDSSSSESEGGSDIQDHQEDEEDEDME